MKKLLVIILFTFFNLQSLVAQQIHFSISNHPTQVYINQSFTIKAQFNIPKGLHIYPQKTEIGMPTKIDCILPKGFHLEEISFPPASEFNFMGITSKGYSESFEVNIKIKVTSNTIPKNYELKFNTSWLACSDTCVPEGKTSTINVDVIASENETTLWVAIIGALLGGLILNVMPCVFPVISLKVMSFAQSAKDSKREIIAHSLVFSVAIIISFASLGITLALIKSLGNAVGWGFQLQSPIFTKVMTALFWLIALSFIGIWEFGNSISSTVAGIRGNNKNKWISSFMSGILAVLIASPCVAPFMASAVGYALASETSPIKTIVIITSVGIGMAIPYVIFAIVPKLIQKLPKSGKWLDILKKILSIPIFITVGWLAWVMNMQGSSIISISIMLLLLGIAAFIWGKYTSPLQNVKTRIIATVVSIIIGLLALFGNYNAVFQTSISKKTDNDKILETMWSEEKVSKLLDKGKIVFVDFTASWCLTCQYNKMIIFSEETKKLFEKNNVTILVADWTNKDDIITQQLKKYGRAGVPLYLIFSPKDREKPQILPSIITFSILSEAIDKIKQ